MIYSLIDRYYASRLGDEAIAAIGASDQVTFFIFTLASGICRWHGASLLPDGMAKDSTKKQAEQLLKHWEA